MASCCCPAQPLRVTRWHQGSCPRALEMEYLGRLPPIPPPTEPAPCWPFLMQRDVWFLKNFASLFLCYCPCNSFIQTGQGFLVTSGRQAWGERMCSESHDTWAQGQGEREEHQGLLAPKPPANARRRVTASQRWAASPPSGFGSGPSPTHREPSGEEGGLKRLFPPPHCQGPCPNHYRARPRQSACLGPQRPLAYLVSEQML